MNGEGSVYHRASDDRWVGAVVIGYTAMGTVRRKTVEVVSDILGHSSIRMTADVYGHILEPQRRAAADAMGNALWGDSASSSSS
jgi:integrase